MCIAELNKSTAPCGHTYFRLNRACSTETSLANCSKLSLSGWENRSEVCAVCDQGALADAANLRLLGSDEWSRVPSANISRTSSLSTLATAAQDSRRGSLARSEGSTTSVEQSAMSTYARQQLASQQNIGQNQRIDAYLAQLPGTVSRADKRYEERSKGRRSRGSSTSSLLNASHASKWSKRGIGWSREIRSFF